ncbi:hypothetical protein KPATCC21470_0097 [Kitasatospora purpeofusca]
MPGVPLVPVGFLYVPHVLVPLRVGVPRTCPLRHPGPRPGRTVVDPFGRGSAYAGAVERSTEGARGTDRRRVRRARRGWPAAVPQRAARVAAVNGGTATGGRAGRTPHFGPGARRWTTTRGDNTIVGVRRCSSRGAIRAAGEPGVAA